MIKMSSMPCEPKTIQKSLSLKLMDQSPLALVCPIKGMGITKCVQMMVLCDHDLVKPYILVTYR